MTMLMFKGIKNIRLNKQLTIQYLITLIYSIQSFSKLLIK